VSTPIPRVWYGAAVRNGVRLFLVATIVAAAPAALGQPQVLIGARAGVSAPNELAFDPGPMVGIDVAYALQRLVAVELAVDHSFHAVRLPLPTGTVRGSATLANLGVQYRLDITPSAVPYALLAVESRWMRVPGAGTRNFAGGAFALGILAPFGGNWFAGLEARYGITLQGAFPLRQEYLAKMGYRTAAF
jgi:hypothetical protein